MSNYTKHSKEANQKVQEDLDKIIPIIKKEINPVSIILFGGFGKGEGIVEVKNKKITPMNDYDMYVVTKGNLDDDFLDKVADKCAQAINKGGLDFVEHAGKEYNRDDFFHVDLRNINYNKLKKLLPTQRTYELKHGSQIIYGEDVRYLIPNVKVTVSDGIRILFNKMDHILMAKDQKNHEIKLIYTVKAYTDLCSALLMFKNDFAGTYTERNNKIKKHSFPQELKDKIDWATNFRNNPNFEIKDVDKELETAQQWIAFAFKYILKKHLNLKDDKWETIADAVYNKLPFTYFTPYIPHKSMFLAQYYLNIKYTLNCWRKGEKIIKPLLDWKDVGLKVAIPLFLYLYGEKELSEKYLKKVSSKTQPLKQRVLDLYGYYYLQRLIWY